jgi:hypothetical protein
VAKAGWEEKYGRQIKFNTLQAAIEEIKLAYVKPEPFS